MVSDSREILTFDELINCPDNDFSLAGGAIILAAFAHEGVSLQRFMHHLDVLRDKTKEKYNDLIAQGAPDDIGVRLASLKYVLHEEYGYILSEQEYSEDADLIRVIERGRGISVAIGILYMNTARALGWEIEGLIFPGYFLCRLEKDSVRYIFDPAKGCTLMDAHDLRMLVKERIGEKAELSAEYTQAKTNRQILVFLQNYIKHRFIEMGEYGSALIWVERMLAIDPQEYRLLLDAGVLYARINKIPEAIAALEGYIKASPKGAGRKEAELLLYELRMS